MTTPGDETIRPFRIDVPQADLADLADLHERLDRVRRPDELPRATPLIITPGRPGSIVGFTEAHPA